MKVANITHSRATDTFSARRRSHRPARVKFGCIAIAD
jgi:hypothetical protein